MPRLSSKKTASRRAARELEGDVLAALWAAPGPMSPADLQGAVSGDLAYNTVFTILTRLCDKGLVARMPLDRGAGSRPTKDAAELAADQMRAALARGTDHRAVLQHFVSSLTTEDEAAPRRLIEEASPR
jgi:predicted transcriptional regulator